MDRYYIDYCDLTNIYKSMYYGTKWNFTQEEAPIASYIAKINHAVADPGFPERVSKHRNRLFKYISIWVFPSRNHKALTYFL